MTALPTTTMPRDTTAAMINVSINIPTLPLRCFPLKHMGAEARGILAGSTAAGRGERVERLAQTVLLAGYR
jgi:hypothetical protein